MAVTPKDRRTEISKGIEGNKICEDFYAGVTKVKTETYLPKYEAEPESMYKIRKAGTAFINMYAPVIDGLAGMVMSKPPKINGFEKLDSENVDMKSNTLSVFCKETIRDALVGGVCFIALKKSNEENRIYLKRYKYKDLMMILKDESGITKGYVFKEEEEKSDGEFGYKKIERYLVYRKRGGEVWYEKDGKFEKQEDWVNSLDSIAVEEVVLGEEVSNGHYRSKLIDLADLNLVHLTVKTHISNVMLKIGNIQTIFFGDVGDETLKIGEDEALTFTDKSKEGMEYVEATGVGVVHTQRETDTIEKNIDKMTYGIFDLTSANTVKEAESKDKKTSSILNDIAEEIDSKINKVYLKYAELSNTSIEKDARVEFKKDFVEEHLSIEEASKMLENGDMSRETYYEVWQTGKLPKGFDIKEESERIEKEQASAIGAGIDR